MAKKKEKDRDDDRPKRVEPVKRDGAYVMMLFVTFVAVTVGCVLLYLDFDEYGGKQAPAAPAPAVLKLGDAPKADPAPAPTPPVGGGDPMPKTDPMPMTPMMP